MDYIKMEELICSVETLFASFALEKLNGKFFFTLF